MHRAMILAVAIILGAPVVEADALQEALFSRTLAATKCEQVPNNGRYCTYRFEDILEIGIKDVGGTDTVVGFHHSDMRNELYAVLYFGCVAVVPGRAHPTNYNLDYGVFISPKTGLVYHTSSECRATIR